MSPLPLTAPVGAQEARVAQMDAERAIQLLDEGIRLKAPGDVVNCLLYSDRAWWQWKRKCGAHALLDAITAQQFNCPEAGMGWPVFLCGFAWELMGIYSSAVEVCLHMLLSSTCSCWCYHSLQGILSLFCLSSH